MIIECNVWCVGNPEQLIEMGLPEGDSWMPFAFETEKVSAIKLAGENEFVGNDKACLYLWDGTHVTIDLTFDEAIDIWKAPYDNKRRTY